ncbi:MAG: prefoldin subunit beta [Candidatus Altiarchaeota archaeon]|nr:prefoldin subunit beta [Candidatus Altiarchaeota archaeon]
MEELSPQAKHALVQLQTYQQQFQMLIYQKQQLELQQEEINSAVNALEKEKVDEVFKAIGPALVKKKRIDVLADLKQTQEKLEIRVKTFESQEKKLTAKMKELSEKIGT